MTLQTENCLTLLKALMTCITRQTVNGDNYTLTGERHSDGVEHNPYQYCFIKPENRECMK